MSSTIPYKDLDDPNSNGDVSFVDLNDVSRVGVPHTTETLTQEKMNENESRVSAVVEPMVDPIEEELVNNDEVLNRRFDVEGVSGGKEENGVSEFLPNRDEMVKNFEDSNVVTESIWTREGVIDEHREDEAQGAQVTEPLEDSNVGTHVSELGISPQAMEVEYETKASEGSCKQDENQSMGSHSQISYNESNMGSLIVDLSSSFMGYHSKISFDESNMGSLIVDLDSSFGPDGREAKVKDQFDGSAEDGDTKSGHLGKQMVKTRERIAGLEQPKGNEYATSDLVWGKVKSHPWWPGQIFDPSYASEKAMKHYKKDALLIAYFGDESFAWNEPSALKPFKVNFSQMEKQTNMALFHDAINCALDEVSRRVELGLSCSCMPKEIYAEVKCQIVKNAGIREKLCVSDGVDRSFSVASFEPEKLVEYIKALAQYQFDGGHRLEFVIAEAQLLAFYGSKGYFQLPEFHVSEGLSERAENAAPVYENEAKAHIEKGKPRSQHGSSIKRQGNLEKDLKARRKERSLTELMDRKRSSSNGAKDGADENSASKSVLPSSARKRKVIESSSSDTVRKSGRQKLLSSSDFGTESPTSRASKVGERICGIAKQLTGSPPVLKYSGDRFQRSAGKVDGRKKKLHEVDVITHTTGRTFGRPINTPTKISPPDEMLSQLCLAARDPMKGYSFLTTIVGFFTDFRNSISLDCSPSMKGKKFKKEMNSGETSGRSRKSSNSKDSSTDPYDYVAVSDSYWTDRIIQSTPEKQLSHKKQKRKAESPVEIPLKGSSTFEPNTSHDLDSMSDSKKYKPTVEPVNCSLLNSTVDSKQQCPDVNDNLLGEKSASDEKNSGELCPTELILNFTDANSIPSESELNRIFSRFGSLKESETEILRKNRRARVVFRRRNDADAAYSSSGKFSVFGPALVSYKLTPSKASSYTTRQRRENATSLEGNTSQRLDY